MVPAPNNGGSSPSVEDEEEAGEEAGEEAEEEEEGEEEEEEELDIFTTDPADASAVQLYLVADESLTQTLKTLLQSKGTYARKQTLIKHLSPAQAASRFLLLLHPLASARPPLLDPPSRRLVAMATTLRLRAPPHRPAPASAPRILERLGVAAVACAGPLAPAIPTAHLPPANNSGSGTAMPIPYTKHGPLLLLDRRHLAALAPDLDPARPAAHAALWARLAAATRTTHVALAAPIARTLPPAAAGAPPSENTLRLPAGLVPLHGDFGPRRGAGSHPSASDLRAAFWARATQHGVVQVWAPLHTMFSRGNVREKARILSGFGASSSSSSSLFPGGATTVVDLYAGIGYFAFFHHRRALASGPGSVALCWELSGWSVEGWRRGCAANGWGRGRVVGGGEAWHGGEALVMFHEDNSRAGARVEALRRGLPPVRHVNCGYLPSSRPSWETAVRALDPVAGGWVHAHENVGAGDVEERRGEVEAVFRGLVLGKGDGRWEVECTHVERVKTYAPGVWHCVLDVLIVPGGRPATPRPSYC